MTQRIHWYHILLSMALSAAAFFGWRLSLVSMPLHLRHVTGIITSSEIIRGGRARNIHFSLGSREFIYPGILPAMDLAVDLIKPGNTAVVGYSGGGSPELWELTVNGQLIVQPAAAHEARLANGKWAFWLFVLFAAGSIYLTWRYRKQPSSA
jgi:hypothetical protein